MTAWQTWHTGYRDAGSDLAKRLTVVQDRVAKWADAAPPGPLRLISICAGQGDDVVGALGRHRRRRDVSGVLVELDEANVAVAQRGLQESGLDGVTAVVGDAARLDAFTAAIPADLLLVCGVFGNISDEDVHRTIISLPMLASSGATVIWTRHRRAPDLTDDIRGWFRASGFVELGFTSPGLDRFSVGTHRYAGEPQTFQLDASPLFTFRS